MVVPIKFRLFFGCFILVTLCCLGACDVSEIKQSVYEVDLKEKTAIQIEYNGNVYNTFVSFNSGCLEFEFANNGDAYDGLCFFVGKDFCQTRFKGVAYEIPQGELTRTLFVCDLYSLLSAGDGIIVTESFNELLNCSYVSRRQGSHSFVFEVFETDNKLGYSLKII